jgi:hypothetical protein
MTLGFVFSGLKSFARDDKYSCGKGGPQFIKGISDSTGLAQQFFDWHVF